MRYTFITLYSTHCAINFHYILPVPEVSPRRALVPVTGSEPFVIQTCALFHIPSIFLHFTHKDAYTIPTHPKHTHIQHTSYNTLHMISSM